jgi:hypothetical protein
MWRKAKDAAFGEPMKSFLLLISLAGLMSMPILAQEGPDLSAID